MERRQDERQFRRLPVRFWVRDEGKERVGFTTNISTGGMFIGSNQVVAPGTRLRVEVLDSANGFVVEGQVTRAVRAAPHLRAVQSSGMGVRFVPVAELVQEFFLRPAESQTAPWAPPPAAPAGDAAPAAAAGFAPPAAPAFASPAASIFPPPAAPAVAAPAAPVFETPREIHPVFAMRFADLDSLRKIYQRDISQGGLFVSPPDPARLHQTVVIELHLPSGPPFSLMARVVQRFEPKADGVPNLLCGMGVELFDLASAKAALQAVLA